MINDNIISFLTNRAWNISGQNNQFMELVPPTEFSLPENFRLHIPRVLDKVDSNIFINNILEILSEFYSLSIEDLNVLLKNESTVLKIRINDEKTSDGKISLTRFDDVVDSIRSILRDTASFVIDKSVTSSRVPDEVSRYLNLCNFMQTEKGSFVAKIQLPSKELIKESELFDREEIFSQEINNKLSEVLNFVNLNILEGDAKASEEYLIENETRINIKLFKDIESFFDKANLKNVDFTFHNIARSNTIENQNITKQKLFKLSQFVEQIESHAYEVDNFTFSGKIVSLKSKDPDGLKNIVTFTCLYESTAIIVSANLDSEHYKDACEAHIMKQNIVISGLAKKTKTRARFIEITKFQIED